MKKLLSVALLVTLIFFITSCGNSDSQNVSTPPKPSQESSSSEKSAQKPSSSDSAKSSIVPDLPEKHWARQSVLYVVKNEILPPYADDTFRGDRDITSYEFAMGLAKILDDTYKGTIKVGSMPFNDIPEKHWAYERVAKLAAAGVVEGYGDGGFHGDRPAIRYETALYAAHLLSAVAPNTAKSINVRANPFADIPKDHWAYYSVALLAGAGVDEGYADGSYRGDRPRTRYEAAQLLAKLHMSLKKAN